MQLAVDESEPGTAKMTIYGDISSTDWMLLYTGESDGLTTRALDVAQALAGLPDDVLSVEVHINSYGGEVAEGAAIYNALRGCGREVTTVCDGFACSIASVIFMAGSRRVMEPASMLMLHNPLLERVSGNARQLRKAADDLDAIAGVSKAAYLGAATIGAEELDAVMDAETWVTPAQAVEWGLATEVAEDGASGAPVQVADGIMAALAGAKAPAQAADPVAEPATEPADPDPVPAPADPDPEPRGFQRLARMLAQ